MSGILHFACVQNLVWTPGAREIHSAIWDRVGLKIVQGRVREQREPDLSGHHQQKRLQVPAPLPEG